MPPSVCGNVELRKLASKYLEAGGPQSELSEENNTATPETNYVASPPAPSKAQYGGAMTTGDFGQHPCTAVILGGCDGIVQLKNMKNAGADIAVLVPEAPSTSQYKCSVDVVSEDTHPTHATTPKIRSSVDKKFLAKVFAGLLIVHTFSGASGSLQCDANTSHALPGATIHCTCNVTARAVTQYIVNNTCIISLSTTPPCTGTALSHGTCGDYISATTNGNACAISNLTIVAHPSVNNTQIVCKDLFTGIAYSINLIIQAPSIPVTSPALSIPVTSPAPSIPVTSPAPFVPVTSPAPFIPVTSPTTTSASPGVAVSAIELILVGLVFVLTGLTII